MLVKSNSETSTDWLSFAKLQMTDSVWCWSEESYINLLAPELFFLILAHTVYKMWIKQEPNMLELWNKLHSEEKKTESIYHV